MSPSIGQIFTIDRDCLPLTHSLGVNFEELDTSFYGAKHISASWIV